MNAGTHGKIALLAAPIIMALLFGCVDPLDITGLTDGEDPYITPPAGKRYLVINVDANDTFTRAIVPVIPSIARYDIIAIASATTTDSFTGSTGTILLDADQTYDITVHAIEAGSNNIVAAAKAAGITKSNTTIALTMEALTGEDNGTFVYNFTSALPTNFLIGTDKAELSFTRVGGTGTTSIPTTIPISNNGYNNAAGTYNNCPTGIFRASLKMTKTDYVETVYEDLIYVYQNMTTTMAPGQIGPLAKNVFNVNYNVNSSTASWAGAPGSDNFKVPLGTILASPATPNNSNTSEKFVNWYTGTSATTTGSRLWIFQNQAVTASGQQQKVINDVTLYAAWGDGTFISTITITQLNLLVDNPTITSSVAFVSQDEMMNGPTNSTIKISLDNASLSLPTTSVVWRYNGVQISNDTGVTIVNNGTTEQSLEIDFSAILGVLPPIVHPYNNLTAEGAHTILIEALSGGKQVSTNVQIVVTK